MNTFSYGNLYLKAKNLCMVEREREREEESV